LQIPKASLRRKLATFLEEDVGLGDITTDAIVPEGTHIRAQIVAKEDAVIAGIFEAEVFFKMLGVKFNAMVEDGEEIPSGKVIAEIEGDGRTILMAERTILNLIMRMSGIATATLRLVKKVRDVGFNVKIAATRKTVSGLRYFDKKAVIIGGGDPHRLRLDDAFLIKDNHIEIAGSISEAVRRVRKNASFSKKIEVEARTLEQAVEAAKLGVDIVMIDNMKVEEAEKTIETLKKLNLRDKILIEISGGVKEENILEYAKLRPDIISLGSLTHSVRSIDLSLEVVEVQTNKT